MKSISESELPKYGVKPAVVPPPSVSPPVESEVSKLLVKLSERATGVIEMDIIRGADNLITKVLVRRL